MVSKGGGKGAPDSIQSGIPTLLSHSLTVYNPESRLCSATPYGGLHRMAVGIPR